MHQEEGAVTVVRMQLCHHLDQETSPNDWFWTGVGEMNSPGVVSVNYAALMRCRRGDINE